MSINRILQGLLHLELQLELVLCNSIPRGRVLIINHQERQRQMSII
jgi:hypothetical protein